MLAKEHQARATGKDMTAIVARKTLLAWLEESETGQTIEAHVARLLTEAS